MNLRAKALVGSLFVGSLVCSLGASVPVRADAPLTAGNANGAIELTNLPSAEGGVEWGRAEGIVDARPEQVLAILQDYAQYAGLFPHFEKSRVLSQRGSDAIVYLEAKVLHGAATLWGNVRMGVHAGEGATQIVEAKMMKGKSNIAQLLARWEVQPVDGGQRSKVAFQLLVDPDLPVPDTLVSSEMKNSAGRALRALRKRATQATVYAARPNHAM